MAFDFNQLSDMHLAYGEAGGNCHEARRIYQHRYPNRVCPVARTFLNVDRRLRESGCFQSSFLNTGRPRTRRTPAFEEEVLQRVADYPSSSTRMIARELNVGKSTVWETLHEELLHPYHFLKVQALGPNDYPLRRQFSQFYLEKCQENADFSRSVLFTDESTFTRQGIFNSRNSHIWAYENPNPTVEHHFQTRYSVNVWGGIVDDFLIGPYLLPQRLTGHNYLIFLQEVLPELLEDVPLRIRQHMWFQHDGAPAHFTLAVRNHLHDTFGARWMGRGGPVAWPARSPDLTPLDYFLWGYMKTEVYSTPVVDELDLVARIVEVSEKIREDRLRLFDRTRQSLLRRCQLCVDVNGQQFQHLL